jgi:hypothetical protein
MSQTGPAAPKFSFDEYKLYYGSTEKVTDRRLATNTWNYGRCIAIMVAVAALASWASSRPDFRLVMLLAILVLAGMGALLCALWIGQIRDFKELNSAKFEVLNAMAPSIRFGADDSLVSATPFIREWDILKAKQATQEMVAMNIIALRSSNAEILVPAAFRWLFLLMLASATIVIAVNWAALTGSIFELKQPVIAAPSPNNPGRP